MAAGYTVKEIVDPSKVKALREAAARGGHVFKPGMAPNPNVVPGAARAAAAAVTPTQVPLRVNPFSSVPNYANPNTVRGAVNAGQAGTIMQKVSSLPGVAQVEKAVNKVGLRTSATMPKPMAVPPGAVSTVASTAGKVATGLRATGLGHLAVSGLSSALKTANTDTDTYRARLGMGTQADGTVAGDLAARSIGALADLGNTVTFGGADRLGNWLGGNGFNATEDLEKAQAVQPAPAAPSPAAAKPTAPLPTVAPGEAARFGVNPDGSKKDTYQPARTEGNVAAPWSNGKIDAQLAPTDPAAWTARNSDSFGAPAGTKVADKQYGKDTVTMLKDKDGKTTFTNAKSFADMANTPMGVSNVTNADGTKYDAAAHQAKIAAAEADLNAAKAADLDANRAGLRQKPQDLRSILAEKANSPLIAVSQGARQQLAQMDTAAANNVAEDRRADKKYLRDVALKGMEVDAKNPANVLALQKAQLEAERNGRNDQRADAAAFDARRKTALDQVANAYALTSTDKNGNQTQHPNMQLAADIETSFANMPEAIKAQMKQKHGKELAFHEMSANEQRRFAAAAQLRRQLAADSDTLGVSVDSLPTAWDLYSNPSQVQQTQKGTYKVGANNKVDSTPFIPWYGQSTADVERKYGKLTRELQGQF